MIRAIIVDDESHCIDRLSRLLAETREPVQLAGTFRSVEEAAANIPRLYPDLVFLDVELQGKTGFDLLRQIHDITFEVIFTTAFEKYAIQAFKFSALDYLLKPIDTVDLQQALHKLQEKISKEEMAKKFEVLFDHLKNVQGVSRKISIPTVQGLTFLRINDIIRCEADGNYTTFYLQDKQKLKVSKTLKEYEDLLADCNFYRVHHSHLINLSHIKSYQKGKGGSVSMADDSEIEVSSRKKDDFLKKISRL
jgi:two-component system LytT family response regulator